MFPLINPPAYIAGLEISPIVVLDRTYTVPPRPRFKLYSYCAAIDLTCSAICLTTSSGPMTFAAV